MSASSRVIALAAVGLIVAAGVGFAIGKASAGDGDSSSTDPQGAPAIEAPAAVADTPTLQTVGAVPNLKEPPQTSSGGATASPGTGSSPSTEGGGTTSSPPTGTGVPSTPVEPNPVPPPGENSSPEPPPPPPPGEG